MAPSGVVIQTCADDADDADAGDAQTANTQAMAAMSRTTRHLLQKADRLSIPG
jgi:hypothetical protein